MREEYAKYQTALTSWPGYNKTNTQPMKSAEYTTQHYQDFILKGLYNSTVLHTRQTLQKSPKRPLGCHHRDCGSMVTPALGTQEVRLDIAKLL